jgi:hypothetical protein
VFAANRFRLGGIAVLILALACAAAPAQAELPSSWAPGPIQPSPSTAGAHFGQSLVNAGDLNSDGQDDIVVGAPDYTDTELGGGLSGRVYAMTSTGALIWDAKAPFPQASHAGAATGFGTKVAKLEDVGSCNPTGTGCTVGGPDGIAELLVTAPGTDTSSGTGVDQGVVYVLDGASGMTLKPVQLSERPASGTSGFGKSVAALSGQPACDTWGGVGACPYENGSAVALGDVNGGGEPDFAVGAPDFTESDTTLEGVCTGLCPGIGRVYVFHGEAVTGSSQTVMTEATDPAALVSQFPGAVGEGEAPHYGASLGPVGDSGRCSETPDPNRPDATCVKPSVPLTNQPDGRPDLVAGAPGVDLPGGVDAGVVFLLDPAANAAMTTLQSTQVAAAGAFGSFDHSVPAAGNLGAGAGPDVIVGTPGGGAVAYSGDPFGPAPFGAVSDPGGGAFASFIAGLGDIGGDAPNEVALGAPGGAGVGAVHIASACLSSVLRTITDPAGESGAGFGTAIAPVGDRNNDGFLDLAVGAPQSDGGAGHAYVFTSSGPAVGFPGCSAGGGPGSSGGKPNPPAGKVSARVLRRLALVPNRRKLRSGSSLRLKGSLRASAGQASCQRRQKIAIQRRKVRGGRFQTFEVAITARNGRFNARTRPGRSYLYRARVSQTARCMGATSKAAKVVVRKRPNV